MDIEFKTINTADEAPSCPFGLFQEWLDTAEEKEPIYHNAMTLATISPEGTPQVRVVLLRGHDENGFVFYTNTLSAKGQAMAENPYAALCFYWKSHDRQIRIEGTITPVTDQEADDYFSGRPRGSQIGAWSSQQSETLASRKDLEDRIKAYEQQYDGQDVPRPPHWSGYRLTPQRIEFWEEGQFRLHTRVLYEFDGHSWAKRMLNP